jgi:hypothetical protein
MDNIAWCNKKEKKKRVKQAAKRKPLSTVFGMSATRRVDGGRGPGQYRYSSYRYTKVNTGGTNDCLFSLAPFNEAATATAQFPPPTHLCTRRPGCQPATGSLTSRTVRFPVFAASAPPGWWALLVPCWAGLGLPTQYRLGYYKVSTAAVTIQNVKFVNSNNLMHHGDDGRRARAPFLPTLLYL